MTRGDVASPRVSIITPFLNAGRFIQESIESVLSQTYGQWELLLVDDGSTDDSTSIAMRYAMAHTGKIRYFAHEGRLNHGASASRNLGARHAKGDTSRSWTRTTSTCRPSSSSRCRCSIRIARWRWCMRPPSTWFSWSGRPEDAGRDWTWRKYGAPPNTVIDPPRMLIAFLQDGGTVPCMGSVLVRRDAVERVGGWEDSFRYICTDQVFHAKLSLRFPVLIADACWDRYRQHEDSACRTVARDGQSDAAFQRYLSWLETYLSLEPTSIRRSGRRCEKRCGPIDTRCSIASSGRPAFEAHRICAAACGPGG